MNSSKRGPVQRTASRAPDRLCQCSRPLKDTEVLCPVCVTAARRRLAEVASVGADLQETAHRQDRMTVGGPGRGAKVPPLPVNLHASYALQRLFDATRAFSDAPVSSGHSLYMLARLGQLNLPNLLRFEQIVPLVNELHHAVTKARVIVDRPAELVYTGPCGGTTEGPDGFVECFEELWAGPHDVQIHCKVCGTTWGIQARRNAALAAIADLAVTPELLSRALTNYQIQVTRQDLHYWWRKGLITRCIDEHGRSTYRAGQVIDAWHVMQGRGRGRKKPDAAA